MTIKRPLCNYSGRVEELRAGDRTQANSQTTPTYRGGAAWRCAGQRVFVVSVTSNLAITASRLYWCPFSVAQAESLTDLGIYVSTAVAGSASIGIYANASTADGDGPGSLLASVTGLNTGTTGFKSATLGTALSLNPGTTYWAAVICSAAASLYRFSSLIQLMQNIGIATSGSAIVHALYGSGSGSTLPDPAPSSGLKNVSSVSFPRIYFKVAA